MRSKSFRLTLAIVAALAACATAAATAAASPKPGTTTSATTTTGTPSKTPPKGSKTTDKKPPSVCDKRPKSASSKKSPPPWSYPFSGKSASYPEGVVTVRLQLDPVATDGGQVCFAMVIANNTSKTLLFTKTAIGISLDGLPPFIGAQTSETQGGFGYVDDSGWWLRTGTMRPGRVIRIAGKLTVPDRKQFTQGTPQRDATVACAQAMTRETVLGQRETGWPTYKSEVNQHNCAQYKK